MWLFKAAIPKFFVQRNQVLFKQKKEESKFLSATASVSCTMGTIGILEE